MDLKKNTFTAIFNRSKQKEIDTQLNIEQSNQFTLTPSTIEKSNDEGEENKAYQPVKDIANKLLDNDVKNIALTGPYGSGKSSVLLTLQKDYPQHHYLNISLATLDLENEDDSTQTDSGESAHVAFNEKQVIISPKSKSPNQNKEESLNRLIEYSILQQLIYRERQQDLPQSRFKRIKHISISQSLQYSIGIVFFILACCILFEPKFIYNLTLYSLFTVGKNWKVFWDIICFLYIIIVTIVWLKDLIVITFNSKLNKVNLKDGEIDIAESTSIFNKHLDEIMYFFEVTDYNIVIIEDLDRFKTNNIFLKLRELNHLINCSKCIQRNEKRHIVFIYAVRDDIFLDTSRTKFFDYIATVIPVINPSNSGSKLLKALEENGINDISVDVCKDLGLYINDMRILKNIANEFIQYRQKLDAKLMPHKLLGMILYKNYHPDDFALLNNRDGIIYRIINNKVKYHNSVVEDKTLEIKKLREEEKVILHFYSSQKENELRAIYVVKYIEKVNLKLDLVDRQNETYTIKQLIDDRNVFQKLENNELRYRHPHYSSPREFDFSFKEIEEEIDSSHTYRERLEMTPKRLEEIQAKIADLQQEILDLRTLPLHSILTRYSAEDFYKDVEENRIIAYLLIKGYIDEYYVDYISYFYPGVMTASDRDFVLDIKIGIKKDSTYTINKHKSVLDEIPDNAFTKGLILNIDLIDFMLANKDTYSQKLQWIINNIKRKKEFIFIKNYYTHGKELLLFFKILFSIWADFFIDGIIKSKDLEISKNNFEIIMRYFPQENIKHFQNPEIKKYISERFDFISNKLDILHLDNVKFITTTLDIKYNSISIDNNINKELILFLIEGNHYLLNYENVFSLIYLTYKEREINFRTACYTNILKTENKFLINYINSDIDECIRNVFSHESICEEEIALICLLKNDDIDENLKHKYLLKQKNKIKDLASLDEAYRNTAFKLNLISASWENIEKYIQVNNEGEIDETLIEFISKNSNELSTQKTYDVISLPISIKLFIKLLGSNVLPFDNYSAIRKSFFVRFNNFDLSSLEEKRMQLLINTNAINFNEYYYAQIDNFFPKFTPTFVLNNKAAYLSKIDKYPLKDSTAISILNSNLNINQKIAIIEKIELNIITDNTHLADLICSILNQAQKFNVDDNLVITLLKVARDTDKKVTLFISRLMNPNYDKSLIKIGLEALGGDYALIALQKGHRRKFKDNKEHRFMAGYLEQHKFISKKSLEKGMIQMNSRNIA